MALFQSAILPLLDTSVYNTENELEVGLRHPSIDVDPFTTT